MLSAAKVTGPPSTTNTLVLQDGKVKCEWAPPRIRRLRGNSDCKPQKAPERGPEITSRTPAAKFDFAGFFKHMAKVLAAPTVPRVPAAPPPSQALFPSPVASGTNPRPRALSPPPISTLNT
ncbi:hypothetical protein GGX14DRAFT_570103 [Mycena pura]|uniref:Uncharacterized protein n=1 Tax=Mycena pura TaxID=153505 RepID=A0AAD6YBB2_9AGAR|nr:hypothetical protein GGX14DRAFT_570103 [Mycena pura]